MFDAGITRSPMSVTLYTDSYVVRGGLTTIHRRLSDLLNSSDQEFLVLDEVVLREFGSGEVVDRPPFAQINLDTVLFGVAEQDLEALPELRVFKIPERALIILPPFRIVGRIHLPQGSDLRTGLHELTGRFVPVTEAVFWSDALKEERTMAPMVAINHARAHIFAPYEEPGA